MVGLRLNEAKSELEPVQDIQFLGLPLFLDQARVSIPVSKAGEIWHTRAKYPPRKPCRTQSVQIYGITLLDLRSHPTRSSTLEALTTTLSFIRSDKPVFNTAAFRPCSPCYPTQAVAGPIVPHIRNPYLTFPGGVHHFMDASTQSWGFHMGDSQIAGVWTCSERKLHINVLELRVVILALHHWATVLQGRQV